MALQDLGVPLNVKLKERASIYLTNALTGWVDGSEHPTLPFPEFVAERDAADAVKRDTPILVVLGNPPYNGFAGVSGREEGGLAEPYKVDWPSTGTSPRTSLTTCISASSASPNGASPSRPAKASSASSLTLPGSVTPQQLSCASGCYREFGDVTD